MGIPCWSQSLDKYVQAAIANVETKLKASNRVLRSPKHCTAPFVTRSWT